MELTMSHWIYGLFTLIIIFTMIFRKGVVLPTLLGTFLVAWIFNGSLISGFVGVFNANLVAAKELFNIFLIITFMVALLRSLKDLGADTRMIQPIQKVMINSHVSFLVLIGVTYLVSLFFWPTPAVPLICALLVPAAIRAGLPAMVAAMAVALAGQGMALSSDYIIQVAPELSAKAGGIETEAVMDQALLLSVITGFVAISLAYFFNRKSFRSPSDPKNEQEFAKMQGFNDRGKEGTTHAQVWSKVFAVVVPLSMLAVMIYMVSTKLTSGRMGGFEGGNGAAFIGGVAVILLLLATIAFGKQKALDYVGEHITEGFIFAFKAMGPVIPIAGFFFLGSADFAKDILVLPAEDTPSLLFDLVQSSQGYLPQSAFLTAFSVLIIGIITGLDGSGFSGLPLTGALSASLANGTVDASTLAAIGQMGSIWTGGGTIIAWSSLIAIAGFCGVPVMELVRKNFLPVIIGLITSTTLALILL
ncbi:hypothetical protein [Halobacillus karajensis]|uniref:H+/gluconate symporter n=1 Tax=Halobacillus karajensis TaxID=195088 RepID=A0A059NX42_9BACI|nr:hypothetical protein [Halobacillus karajensis]CDQ18881.1 hypothetical protein BN982_01162 [Halobacillus karajensis]CDQ23046.1 hypothetical protein BN983_01265 [Halobacillus karajensis]CDQ26528.1 hypothetical protein BN981_00745 [Halobacillus karajensis]